MVLLGLALSNVRRRDVLGPNAFNTVISSLMEIPSIAHGTWRSHFTCSGSNGTAAVTAGTTVCSLGKKKDRNLDTSLTSITESGHSSAFMVSR